MIKTAKPTDRSHCHCSKPSHNISLIIVLWWHTPYWCMLVVCFLCYLPRLSRWYCWKCPCIIENRLKNVKYKQNKTFLHYFQHFKLRFFNVQIENVHGKRWTETHSVTDISITWREHVFDPVPSMILQVIILVISETHRIDASHKSTGCHRWNGQLVTVHLVHINK